MTVVQYTGVSDTASVTLVGERAARKRRSFEGVHLPYLYSPVGRGRCKECLWMRRKELNGDLRTNKTMKQWKTRRSDEGITEKYVERVIPLLERALILHSTHNSRLLNTEQHQELCCTLFYCTVTVLYCHCTVLSLYYTVTVLYCHCTVLYCTILCCTWSRATASLFTAAVCSSRLVTSTFSLGRH